MTLNISFNSKINSLKISLVFLTFIIGNWSATGQTITKGNCTGTSKSYNFFLCRVDEIYNKLVFNDTYIRENKVEIKKCSGGIAFAYFDRQRNKRFILLNYSNLFNKIWLQDSLKFEVKENIIKGILAHEWAHHYLVHIFEKANIFNERNADILAGRILAQNDVPESTPDYLGKLFKRNKDSQHLPSDIRMFLMTKGFLTEKILSLKDCQAYDKSIQKILDSAKNSLITIEINSLKRILDLQYKVKKDSSIKNTKNLLQVNLENKFKEVLLQDSLLVKDSLLKVFSHANQPFRLTLKEDSTEFKIDTVFISIKEIIKSALKNRSDSLFAISFKNNSYKLDSAYKVANKITNVSSLKNEEKEIIRIKSFAIKQQFSDLKVAELLVNGNNFTTSGNNNTILEILYDKYYIDTKFKTLGIKLNGNCNEQNLIFKKAMETFSKVNPPDNSGLFTYRLKAVTNIIKFDKNKKALTINNITYGICPIDNRYKKCPESDIFFPYIFSTKEGNYFIDKNNFLWTETIGAVSLDDKIFLQRFNF